MLSSASNHSAHAYGHLGGEPLFSSWSEQLAALALHHAVPTIYQYRDFAVAGGLLSYGADVREVYRLAGNYTCLYHKSNPYVLMVQSTKDGPCFDTPGAVNEPSNRRILA